MLTRQKALGAGARRWACWCRLQKCLLRLVLSEHRQLTLDLMERKVKAKLRFPVVLPWDKGVLDVSISSALALPAGQEGGNEEVIVIIIVYFKWLIIRGHEEVFFMFIYIQ